MAVCVNGSFQALQVRENNRKLWLCMTLGHKRFAKQILCLLCPSLCVIRSLSLWLSSNTSSGLQDQMFACILETQVYVCRFWEAHPQHQSLLFGLQLETGCRVLVIFLTSLSELTAYVMSVTCFCKLEFLRVAFKSQIHHAAKVSLDSLILHNYM